MEIERRTIRKERANAPASFFEAEAAGLEWLAEAMPERGAGVAQVVDFGPGFIETLRVDESRPGARAARDFGAALARTHDAGAAGFGAPPDGWGGPCFIGRQGLAVSTAVRSWGAFYAADRVLPYLEKAVARGHVRPDAAALVRAACDRIAGGDFDDDDAPARLHGDLWNGNVLWSPAGVVLIDPAAHGGHRETDLAMLDLFGCPYLDDILTGYDEEHPLRDGWRQRIPLHQLHPLAVHAASHGSGYEAPLVEAARSVLTL
ncbi:fructosamine kinase family protein [Herbiconiux sp. L3-i23]|uniref:fructosamine kinase family protein n=1 Tax=Herbiconiux sp. L3-i23 TaxID=2905871 RepID=UPI002052B671|nr:fructosamine kinase family protein [Herbiconiux sp. L3-i23]BDI21744.1 fructosamine kinase [Herbiconiux sp. L3-i23]